ncbi:MAG: hypothetical protein CMN25_17895 [Salinicola sp.]|uniref:ApeP family dehydratase n=1 Tax=Salinicola sp. TaxID=1978524 RepID=UPI000C907A87|nr:hypothetical protein [Salinicola sp.]MAM59188.1 hypothetical protein [Salinicola sp.]NRB56684.1 hypothetical protein [Salinicola sp.]
MNPSSAVRLPCAVEPLIPHARRMCLLTHLIAATDDGATAETSTRHDDLFAEADGIPAWVGVEWLAQTVAAWAGFQASGSTETPAPGLLLGARRYRARVPVFAFDQRIQVTITVDFVADNGVTQVSGELRRAGTREPPLAHGSLTLYRPDSMPIRGDA